MPTGPLRRAASTLGRTFALLAVVAIALVLLQPPTNAAVPVGGIVGVLFLGAAFGALLAGSYVYYLDLAGEVTEPTSRESAGAELSGHADGVSVPIEGSGDAPAEREPEPLERPAADRSAEPVSPRARLEVAETKLAEMVGEAVTASGPSDAGDQDDRDGEEDDSKRRQDGFVWNDS